MASLEGEVFVCGAWKNYSELEDSVSVQELILTVEAIRKEKYDDRKFAAAMKGISLDDDSSDDPLAKARKRVAAKRAGLAEDDIVSNPDANINTLERSGLGYEVVDSRSR